MFSSMQKFDFPASLKERQRLADVQQKVLKALIQGRDFLKTHQYEFFVEAGTLLGAVRHGGFIPWDDDADLLMLEDHFNRLYQAALDDPDLGRTYHIKITANLDDPWHISIKGLESPFWVDIYSIQAYQSPRLAYAFKKIYSNLYRLSILFNCQGIFPCSKNHPKKIWQIKGSFNILFWNKLKQKFQPHPFKTCLLFIASLIYPARFIFPVFVWLIPRFVKPLTNPKGSYLNFHYQHRFAIKMMHRDQLFPLKEIIFENESFPAPKNPHYFLEQLYGASYMTPPPYESRKPSHQTKFILDET